MAFLFGASATMRLLAMRPGDTLLAWIEQHRIKPTICAPTMGMVYQLIEGAALSDTQRSVYRRRYAALEDDLSKLTEESVTTVQFGYREAAILGHLMMIADEHRLPIHPIDLIPAAISVRNNHILIIDSADEAMKELARKLQPEHGRLLVQDFRE